MNKDTLLANAKKTVGRLIMQYDEYLDLMEEIKGEEDSKLKIVSKLSKDSNISISKLMSEQEKHEELNKLNKEIDLLKLDLQQISDEMTFPNPIVWMMYKFEAYKGKSNEISNMRQFRNHCMPQGYICTERYRFLNSFLQKKYGFDLNNLERYSDDYALDALYSSDLIIGVCNDLDFMKQWKENEYLKTDGKINKWKTVIKNI